MRKLLLLGLLGCQSAPVVQKESIIVKEIVENKEQTQDTQSIIPELKNKVVGLVDSKIYCGGVWVTQNTILTAYHCIKNKSKIYYTKEEGTDIEQASLIKYDVDHDLALLVTNFKINFEAANVAINYPKIGDRLHIIAHNISLPWSYMEGWVSAYRSKVHVHEHGPYLQINASIYYGDSGGGIFNENGELVGIVSFKHTVPNVAFSTDLNFIRTFINNKL